MEAIYGLIGSDADTIVWWQMSNRAILIFLVALTLVRFGGKRIFGKRTSFDIVLGVILGSILSRALTANARFFPTIAAAATLVLLHMLFAAIAFRIRRFGHLIKGKEIQLVEEGEIRWDAMKKGRITRHDLTEALRISGSTPNYKGVKSAYLERSWDISVIKE